MTFILVLLSGIMAFVVGWLLLQTLNVRPWLQNEPVTGWSSGDNNATPPAPVKFGLCVFLTVATSFFGLFISAYFMRREGVDWRPVAVPSLLWFNTLVLMLASVLFQRARVAARRQQAVQFDLWAAGACSWIFLAGQLLAWRQLDAAGQTLSANPANAFFYVLTALHGLHLLGGLVVWLRTVLPLQRRGTAAALALRIELCALYWHFLLALWLVLFAVLLAR